MARPGPFAVVVVAICAFMIATGHEYGGLSTGALALIVLRDNEVLCRSQGATVE